MKIYLINPEDIKEIKFDGNTITSIKLKRKYKDKKRKVLKIDK